MTILSLQRRCGAIAACVVLAVAASPAVARNRASAAVLHSFASAEGAMPMAPLLTVGPDFFGTTQQGGANGVGTVFKMSGAGAVSVLHSFALDGVDGRQSVAGLLRASDGQLYGTAQKGGTSSAGTVFRVSTTGGYAVVHQFSKTDGGPSQPAAALIQATDGNFYGTSYQGGANGLGTVYKMTPSGTVTLLHSLSVADGTLPTAGLIQASDGNFYGTTSAGGAAGVGTVFRVTVSGSYTVLHSFIANATGANPWGGLIQARDGLLYGVTGSGGDHYAGTLFRMTLGGAVTRLASFSASSGGTPTGTLVQGSDGLLYGTTYSSQVPNNEGTVFRATLAGAITTLYRFANDGKDGNNPWAGVIFGQDGRLYGTTANGGANDLGSLFSITLP